VKLEQAIRLRRNLELPDFTSLAVDNGHGMPRVVDEQFFTGPILLAHDHVDLGDPEPVLIGVLAVLETSRVIQSVLLPKQGQG
jgi:hypothetical protein